MSAILPRVSPYRGRFAPSPTGPLHIGSLAAAVGSFLEARAHGGQWLLRIEDVDVARSRPGADDDILRTLEALGFDWDGPVVRQSGRTDLYRDALDRLVAAGLAYGCACTRRELADSVRAADGSQRYPGNCRNGLPPGKQPRAWRLQVSDEDIAFEDGLQGRTVRNLVQDCGDFVLLRADGCFAYQLAVVVDDAEQGITHVVRGADLVESTPRQIRLQRCLGLPSPAYAHLPVIMNAAGEKLSKQTRAAPVDTLHGVGALHAALRFLGQQPPESLVRAGLVELWQWARAHWRLDKVPRHGGAPLVDRDPAK